MRNLWSVLALLAAGGCTHLSTTPDHQYSKASNALRGTPYSLPMLQYGIALEWSLSSCPGQTELKLGDGDTITWNDQALGFKEKATATARYVPGETYVVDYAKLSSPFKTTSFSIEPYASGALKAINVSADDKTGEIIKDTVKTGLAIATLASGVPLPLALPSAAGGPSPSLMEGAGPRPSAMSQQRRVALRALKARVRTVAMVVCTDEAASALTELKTLRKGLPKAVDTLENATDAATRALAVAALRSASGKHVDELAMTLAAQDTAAAAVAKLKDAIDEEAEGVSLKPPTMSWPTRFDDATAQILPDKIARSSFVKLLEVRDVPVLTREDLAAWLKAEGAPFAKEFRAKNADALKGVLKVDGTAIPRKAPSPDCEGATSSADACVVAQLAVRAILERGPYLLDRCAAGMPETVECRTEVAVGPKPSDAVAARDAVADQGIFVRPPVEGIFHLCRTPGRTCVAEDELIDLKPVSAPQLGQLRFLPFRSRAFESNALALLLREDGSIEKFEYKRTAASAAGAAAAVADAATQVRDYEDKRRELAATARAEEIAKIQYQIDLLDKRKALAKALEPATVDAQQGVKDETVSLQAETALLNAKLAKLQARKALDAEP